MSNPIQKERYEIIKPFLAGNKSLVELSEKSGVSYSTLKRWVAAYKRSGMEGLKKSQRADKNKFRSVDDEVIGYIKDAYIENPNIKIFDLYKEIVEFLKKINQKIISYDTVYRIVNNLDPFVKDYAHIEKIAAKYSNQIFEFSYIETNITFLDERDDKYKKLFLNVVIDSYSKAAAGYSLTFCEPDVEDALLVLRQAVTAKENNAWKIYGLPEEYLIHGLKPQNKAKIKDISDTMNFSVSFIETKSFIAEELFAALEDEFLAGVGNIKALSYFELNKAVEFFIINGYNLNVKYKKPQKIWENGLKFFKEVKNSDILDILLKEYKSERKVHGYGVRFQNILYESALLKDYVDKTLKIYYSSYDLSEIKLYKENNLVCTARCPVLDKYKISLHELECLMKILKIKEPDKQIVITNLARELETLLLELGYR